jgi:hypothetical protein
MNDRGDLIVAGPAEVEWLVDQLRGRGWRTAADLGAKTESQKRRLRLIVEASSGAILSYPGSPGYRLFDEATLTEIHRSVALRAQVRVMLRRYLCYMRRLHRRSEPPIQPDFFQPTLQPQRTNHI